MVRSLALVFLLFVAGIFATPLKLERAKQLTNAARFQAGLPPLPPSRREAGMLPRGSGVSNNGCPGKTYVSVKKDSKAFGHLGHKVGSTTGAFDIITSAVSAWQYLEVATSFDSAPHDIKLTNTNSTYKYLGLADATNGSIEELGFAFLVATNQTLPGAKPTDIGNSRTSTSNPHSLSESAIWSVSSSTKAFYPVFIDSDGTPVSAQGAIKQVAPTAGQSGWSIEFVGDWEEFSQSSAGEGWEKADFYLECASW
ncbi:hypothetical protein CALCODRAFT_557516 [Calocera cornea HHB12733]|uniref:Uncharacterized protein n=1 Tax=Calocera cornea HHB12733 TaxID=1353952 RepID=A0A165DT52_9BASI|nr:hypothetical protein CALCODRAFT_557516 [Calocera cornea HHB12733]